MKSILAAFFYFAPQIQAFDTLPVVRPEEAGMSLERLNRIDEIFQNHVDNNELSGAVTMIMRRGKCVHNKAYGWMDVEEDKRMSGNAIFRIQSMTKIITAAAVMILYEEGRFALNDPVSKFIAEFEDMEVAILDSRETGEKSLRTEPAASDITIRDLLRHTSGITYGSGYPPVDSLYNEKGLGNRLGSLADFVKSLSELPLCFNPGTNWEYGYSYDVLGYLVEVISGRSLARFMKERIFEPLDMQDTDFHVPDEKIERFVNLYEFSGGSLTLVEYAHKSDYRHPPAACQGGGGLVSTATDFGRFLEMLLNKGVLDGRRILSRKTVELMFSDHLVNIPKNWLWPGTSHGLCSAILLNPGQYGEVGSPGQFWWAGALNTHFFVDPKEELIGIIMMQMLPFEPLEHHTLMMIFRRLCLQAIDD
jgi:CubicO group peptidase (beta-lactamase class C family)